MTVCGKVIKYNRQILHFYDIFSLSEQILGYLPQKALFPDTGQTGKRGRVSPEVVTLVVTL
jgi:hypothetical protein